MSNLSHITTGTPNIRAATPDVSKPLISLQYMTSTFNSLMRLKVLKTYIKP
ncbi:hypothetical protein [Rubritalea tangerina]|uniref:hypothetical protein n=1 Tax=Rubritalea tangerina TaxID=430798 RepID=UPI00361FF771